MNLQADIRAHILANLPHDVADAVVVAELAVLPLARLLIAYHNWLSRLVRAVPRSVHLSREFAANPKRKTHAAGIADAFGAIQQGRDLTPRLSKLIRHGYVGQSKSTSRDKDLMLNDWGVHHLHLGIGPDANDPTVVQRTGDLLFLIFRPTAEYVIDIFAHQAWTDREIVRIAVGNWPRLEFFLEMKGVHGSLDPATAEEHLQLRRARLASMVEIASRLYAGTGVLSNAGTSINSSRGASDLLRRVHAFEAMWQVDPDRIMGLLSSTGAKPPPTPEFEFIFMTDGFGVRETTTGIVIELSGNTFGPA